MYAPAIASAREAGSEGSIDLTTPFSRIIGVSLAIDRPNRTFPVSLHRLYRSWVEKRWQLYTKGAGIRRFLGIAALLAVIVLAGSGAAAAAAPSATTGPVTAVGPTTATVGGTVNPGGQATTWYVEYGTSTSYGSKTANVSAGSGTANTAVSANLTGLAPGTTYHYRVVATNSAGTARGADGIFSTSAAPVAVTGSATSVTVTSATLNGTVDPNGRATTWYFEYGTSTSYGSRTADRSAGSGTSTTNVSAPVADLARGRLYHYRLVATSDAGTSRGADQTFSTTTVPTVVTNAASSIGLTSARLNGRVTPNGQATTWYFDYGTTTSYGSRTAAKSAGSGTGAVNVSSSLTAPADDDHLPLPPGRDERLRDDPGQRPDASARRSRRSVQTGAARDVGSTTATLTGSANPRGRATTWWFEYGTTTRYGSQTSRRSAGSGSAARSLTAAVTRPQAGDDLPLPARRDERRRLEPRRRRRLHDRRRDARRARAPRRLRPRHPAGRNGSGEAGRRDRDGVRPGVRRRLVRFDRDRLDRGRRNVALSGEAEDPHVLPGELGRRHERGRRPWASGRRSRCAGPRPACCRRASPAFAPSPAASSSSSGETAAGRWVTIKRLRLNGRSAALFRPVTFRAALPSGRSTLRVAMSINQAGAGYLGGFSRTIVFRRA